MKRKIDCLLVGYNDMDFTLTEKRIGMMGKNSGPYRKLNLGFIEYNNKPCRIRDIFNLQQYKTMFKKNPFDMDNMFSATIAYLGTYCAKHNISFDYIHSFYKEKEEFAQLLLNSDIVSIAVITTLYMDFFPILDIIQFIRKFNKKVTIIVGGTFIWTKVRDLETKKLTLLLSIINADIYVNSHQGETTLITIISAIKHNKPLNTVANIYYKQDNTFVATQLIPENNKLEENPVQWDLFSDQLRDIVPIRTSYSCPFKCNFCSYPLNKQKYEVMSVDTIKQELHTLIRINNNLHVSFIDDTFNYPKKRFKEFLLMLLKNKFTFTWDSNIRCQFLDKELVKMMIDSGCRGVYLGIESGSQSILDNMNKKVKIDDLKKGLELLHTYNIITCASFIMGFPGETEATIECTKEFITNHTPIFYQCHAWYYEPYTPIWEKRQTYDIQGEYFDWKHRTMDINTAMDSIDYLVKTINTSLWLPQNDFEYYGILHLLNSGVDLNQIKNFFRAFCRDLRLKLNNETPAFHCLHNPFTQYYAMPENSHND